MLNYLKERKVKQLIIVVPQMKTLNVLYTYIFFLIANT